MPKPRSVPAGTYGTKRSKRARADRSQHAKATKVALQPTHRRRPNVERGKDTVKHGKWNRAQVAIATRERLAAGSTAAVPTFRPLPVETIKYRAHFTFGNLDD